MSQPVEELRETDFLESISDMHIAIIDDDNLFRIMLQDFLHEAGSLNSELFASGNEFLKNYKRNDVRVIILDYEFGEGPNGLEILRSIKKINPLARVIIVSALDNLERALETIRNGAADYFLKYNTTVFSSILCSLQKLRELEKHKLN